jgi:hypothetical protein
MQAKKKLISKLALGAGAVLVIAAIVAWSACASTGPNRRRFEDSQERAKQQRIEKARAYLAELAGASTSSRSTRRSLSEIESHYFEEQASGPFYVWAMDTKGDFQFGVPQAAFNKVNAVYDSEVTPRLKEGVFLDRQTFLMSLVDDSDEISPELVADGKPQLAEGRVVELVERGAALPLQPLGARALVRAVDSAEAGRWRGPRQPLPQAVAGARQLHHGAPSRSRRCSPSRPSLMVASIAALWVLLPTWVYVDARGRGVRRAPLFAFLTVISSLVGSWSTDRPPGGAEAAHLPRLRARSERRAFCPHCGRDLSVGDLLRLPLSAEAGLGLLPRVPQRDQAAGRRNAGARGG